MGRFKTEILTTLKNLKSFMDVSGKWIDRAGQRRSLDKLILDPDSSASETYGRRERRGSQFFEGLPSRNTVNPFVRILLTHPHKIPPDLPTA